MNVNLRGRPAAGLLILFFLFFLAAVPGVQAQSLDPETFNLPDEPSIIILADPRDGSEIRNLAPAWAVAEGQAKTATIIVEYVDPQSWDPQAIAAFEYAKSIWETLIVSPVPIRVRAEWTDMNYLGRGVLGGAWPEDLRANFTGAGQPNTRYVSSLANHLAKRDLDERNHDINAQFNSGFSNWYFGTDGAKAGKYDLVSVVLHELGHGLGFYDSFNVSSGIGSWGAGTFYPIIYDRFVANGAGQLLLENYQNHSAALGYQLQSNNIFFVGPAAVAANRGAYVPLYAPYVWSSGSSIAHLGQAFEGTPNALMTYSLAAGEVQHSPGLVALGGLKDLGWGTGVAQSNLSEHLYLPLLRAGQQN